MPSDEPAEPIVPFPERLDRRLRLGPFPSGREALKFVVYAAVGAVAVPFAGAGVWLACVAAGLAVSLWRPEGVGWDTRLLSAGRWWLRRQRTEAPMSRRDPAPSAAGAMLPISPSGYVAAVRTRGVPLAYLPPAELRRRFDLFRELLRGLDGSVVLLATSAPIHGAALLPPPSTDRSPERAARDGYRELVELIVRRRSVRQVFIAIAEPANGADGARRLEDRLISLGDHLAGLGLTPERVRGRALQEISRRLGLHPRDRAP